MMFTGIIQQIGRISAMKDSPHSRRLEIETTYADLVLGESIAVDGCCLTVANFKNSVFTCELSQETLSLTTAAHWHTGTRVNLERAMTLNDRFGGHIVTGHIDHIAIVHSIEMVGDCKKIQFSGIKHSEFTIKKGSIAINGVSLTINAIENNIIEVMLIPHTLIHTNLQFLEINSEVNVEYDYLSKVAVNYFQKQDKE